MLAACLVSGVVVGLHTIPTLHNTRIAATRTPVPGSRDVKLAAGKYVIYYEADTTGGNIGLAAPHGVVVRIEAPAERALALRTYHGNFHTGSSYVDARAFLTVRVPRTDVYRITAGGHSSQPIAAAAPRVVLGEQAGARILRLVGAGVVALLAFIGLCLLLPAWIGSVRGRRGAFTR